MNTKLTFPVQVTDTNEFIYQPPTAAINANRILVKPNLGYPVAPPVTVSMKVLAAVLQGLRSCNPHAEILIVEGVCSPVSLGEIASRNGLYSLLDAGMQLLDADELALKEYPNLSPQPVRFKTMLAPAILEEVDCRISVGAFKRTYINDKPLISASLKNLYGLFPRSRYKARSPKSRGQLHRPSVPLILQDVYFTIGHLFNGAVVDGNLKFISADWKPDKGKSIELGKVFAGEDMLTVDRVACEIGGETIADYLDAIESLRG
ncbi:DUF362 domain-containing protein [Trichormus variabilis]|uniref:DUF362 domain-containing protein n=1 Tax=Trichormus variabilis SAG 1403-4b TaxID=447716 RepID=A0A433UW81_ANAVA|nr:DUF362 domain-containing protein [Trichormus variabilis]MBD2626271.1 DUF362 domain-containing protein [Trichormus variabilis FACHB-164]RUS98111.1 hypothetical protein DSM107003_11990 [Trichormus variabilis SAG 1403-4b]